jgi:hypothetical protein
MFTCEIKMLVSLHPSDSREAKRLLDLAKVEDVHMNFEALPRVGDVIAVPEVFSLPWGDSVAFFGKVIGVVSYDVDHILDVVPLPMLSCH